ncbi:hypothetical protein QBC46DRAFT_252266 [Diplogelasinospora grovesii]|uniref:Peptidase C14 caspase domain-containing protein n=1 Tax=Diplogelasinospora grovesii TaxID=303347 RepID=A0AAN6NHV8_9PEZI|nr:hypothetical protein QBC46DRAFT_252266 [Diplogelasinospora grovesii]
MEQSLLARSLFDNSRYESWFLSDDNRLRRRQYRQVHVLILTWAYHDLKPNITTPAGAECISLEEETERLRDSFEGFGYRVHEYLIPMQRSSESLRARLRQFCRYASDDTLLIVYYHGHGSLNDDKELVFSSHEHPTDPRWSQAAAAELYAALITGEACSTHSRSGLFQQLTQKYARFRPIAEVKWDDIRGTILGAPCDLLLILDCCAAGGANLRRVDSHPLPPQAQAEGYTKHLFAACGFESSTVDDMTATMCDVLDQYVPDPSGAPLTTKRLHQIMEERLQDSTTASQPIFKQLLPMDPERYITLPNLRDRAKRYL